MQASSGQTTADLAVNRLLSCLGTTQAARRPCACAQLASHRTAAAETLPRPLHPGPATDSLLVVLAAAGVLQNDTRSFGCVQHHESAKNAQALPAARCRATHTQLLCPLTICT